MTQFKKSFENFEWLDLVKPNPKELVKLTEPYKIDINLLDDALEHGHLPKLENHGNFTFIIFRAYTVEPQQNFTTVAKLSNKIAFLFNEGHLITVHQKSFKFVDKFKNTSFDTSEALMLAIILEMVLTFEGPVDWLSNKMDENEKDIFLGKPGKISIEHLYFQKSKARICRKLLQLSQNVLNQLTVNPDFNSNLQDIKESIINYMLQLDEVIEDAHAILNTHISLTAQKSNEVMKLLTVFSAFFLPLTFIVGVYGMNFKNIPELEWKWGYLMTWVVMIGISTVIFLWFKRKKFV